MPGRLSQWQDASGLGPSGYHPRLRVGRYGGNFATREAAERQAAALRRTNPRREFRAHQIRGPRGGISYGISVKLTAAEYKRESAGF